MTTPTGTIKASDIANEFGYSRANNSISLGNYRISQTVSGLVDLPLDTGVPQFGAISFDSLRGKKLNIVVDCTPAPGTVAVKVNAKTRYDSDTSITYIGNFLSKPLSTADKKVWIHINGTFAPEGQTGKIIYFSTSKNALENNYIYLSADGYPTLTFGPSAGDYYYAVYNGVQYSVSGNSGLKLALNGSTQVRSDDYGSRGDGDYDDLVLNAGEGSFYESDGSIFYKFGSTLINRTRCSFLTGSWDPKTDLHIDIGPSGRVYGSGGNGGYNSAFDGTSAIGIIATNKVVITNRGSVLPGGGGGGKGGDGANGSKRVLTYPNGYRFGAWITITTYGGGGGTGGIGQGYGYSNAAGAAGAAGGGSGAGAGGQGGTGGTWGKPGGDGARGGPNSQGTAGLGGGEGGYDYVFSNDGTGVSGLSPNVAFNTIPT
jgi:hypothetical protein